MGENAGAVIGFEVDFLERGIGWQFDAVDVSESAVEPDRIAEQELAVIGRVAVEQVVEREFERRAEIGGDVGREVGKGLRIFREIARLRDLQPAKEEVAQFGFGAQVRQHALKLARRLAREW